MALQFLIDTDVKFECTVGPFGADVTGNVAVDNLGVPLTISFGLNDRLNYYLSSNTSLARNRFVTIPTITDLVNKFDIAIAGRVIGDIDLSLRVPPPFTARARIQFGIPDVNLLLDPLKRKSAFAIIYEVEVSLPKRSSFIGACDCGFALCSWYLSNLHHTQLMNFALALPNRIAANRSQVSGT